MMKRLQPGENQEKGGGEVQGTLIVRGGMSEEQEAGRVQWVG